MGAPIASLGNSHSLAVSRPSTSPLGYEFTNVADAAGLRALNVFGGEQTKQFLIETTGCGVAFFDYDNDGWLDIFVVNGSRLENFPPGAEPLSHLYKNNRDGTFTDVTQRAGLTHRGWGQGVCVGDYDNDGFEDLFVTSWGKVTLYHNNGDGTFTDVTEKAGLTQTRTRWNTGCAFLDYDRDGHLDLFVANYVDFDLRSAPKPGESLYCWYRGIPVNCGPRGLAAGTNILYHNKGDGTFEDASARSGITKSKGRYSLGVCVADYNNDGWPDIFVAADQTACMLYHNNHDGTFSDIAVLAGCAFNEDGMVQSGMGVTAGDYDCDGWLDIFKTNFSDERETLYHNDGHAVFDDVTARAGLALNTRFVGWGCGFFDPDNDGWLDLFLVNGHIYPEVERLHTDVHYRDRKILYRNRRDGTFDDVSLLGGPAILEVNSSRGCAFGDFDSDGDIDIVINNMNQGPSLLRCDSNLSTHWLKVRTVGTRSNRSGIGARIRCVTGQHLQIDEVRSGGSYCSQNDLRVHFGLGDTRRIDALEILWPSGTLDRMADVLADQLVVVKEGVGIIRSETFGRKN